MILDRIVGLDLFLSHKGDGPLTLHRAPEKCRMSMYDYNVSFGLLMS